jgi:hypothetical protein
MNAQQNLDPQVDQQITINGTAYDAMMGAVVVLDDRTPVYVDGLTRWDTAAYGQSIEATGTLRKRSLGPDPVVDADGGVSHGIEGSQYILEDPQWQLAN